MAVFKTLHMKKIKRNQQNLKLELSGWLYNKDAMKETIERVMSFVSEEDRKVLQQVEECLSWPLQLYALDEAEYQTEQIIDDLLEYDESDMKNSIRKLAEKLYNECETFNNGEAAYEMSSEFWNMEEKQYSADSGNM